MTVEIMLRTIFCAVPAFIRVEPVIASGPTVGIIEISATLAIAESGLHVMHAVKQPRALAYLTAPIVYGVRPDAAIPTTVSDGVRPLFLRSSAPASALSSLDSVGL